MEGCVGCCWKLEAEALALGLLMSFEPGASMALSQTGGSRDSPQFEIQGQAPNLCRKGIAVAFPSSIQLHPLSTTTTTTTGPLRPDKYNRVNRDHCRLHHATTPPPFQSSWLPICAKHASSLRGQQSRQNLHRHLGRRRESTLLPG
jgi:hypothetical protein